MKCPVCSQVYPDALGKCSRCGRAPSDREAGRDASSTLIEFPAPRVAARPSVPEWRAELNEKVRAIKARRSMEAIVNESVPTRQMATVETVEEPAPEQVEAPPDEGHANPIVAAALNRVRRASEQAARVTSSQSHATATARAALPIERAPLPAAEAQIIRHPAVVEPQPHRFVEERTLEVDTLDRELFDPSELLDGLDGDLGLLDDLDEPDIDFTPPVDVVTPPAPLLPRFVAGVVDLIVLAAASVPFVATTYAIDGDLARTPVLGMLASLVLLIAGFYLFATLAISGRTVGMMLTRLRVVEGDGETARPGKLLVRVVGYLVAALPAGIGFAWAILHPDGNGWHDLLSGTRVIRD